MLDLLAPESRCLARHLTVSEMAVTYLFQSLLLQKKKGKGFVLLKI